MTNKFRVQVLKEVLKIYTSGKTKREGLCYWLWKKSDFVIDIDYDINSLQAIKKYKPKKIRNDGYWFPRNKSGNQERIKILKALIKYYSARNGKKYAKSRTRT